MMVDRGEAIRTLSTPCSTYFKDGLTLFFAQLECEFEISGIIDEILLSHI